MASRRILALPLTALSLAALFAAPAGADLVFPISTTSELVAKLANNGAGEWTACMTVTGFAGDKDLHLAKWSPNPGGNPSLVLTNDDIPEGEDTGPPASFAPQPELVMYSAEWCGVCRRAKTLLDGMDADYVEKDIDKSPEARREYVATFGSDVRVPGFAYDGESHVGLRPAVLEKWVAEMKARR